MCVCVCIYIYIINVGVRANLHVPRLISRILKLTTMEASSGHEIYETRTDDL
jgi:hypothetical protein